MTEVELIKTCCCHLIIVEQVDEFAAVNTFVHSIVNESGTASPVTMTGNSAIPPSASIAADQKNKDTEDSKVRSDVFCICLFPSHTHLSLSLTFSFFFSFSLLHFSLRT